MAEQLYIIAESTAYLVTLPFYIILLIIEIIIFFHFIIKTYGLQISKLIKYYALTLIGIVIITLSLELWSILIDLSTTLPQSSGYCFIQEYLRILSFIMLESTLFIFWVIRLRHTFNESVLALSNIFVYTLFILIPLLCVILMIILAIFLKPKYHFINISFSSSLNNGQGCAISINSNITIKIILIIAQILAITFNIFFGLLFYRKLSQFASIINHSGDIHSSDRRPSGAHNERTNVISVLMQKHTLLALISVISAIAAYIIFNILIFTSSTEIDSITAFQYGFLLIDVDMVIKSITCLLMFKFYESKFFKLCWCCIHIATIDCDCCNCGCCSVNDPTQGHTVSMFQQLKDKAEVVRQQDNHNINAVNEDDDNDANTSEYDDKWGEDCDIFGRKSKINRNVNKPLPDLPIKGNISEEEQYKIGDYVYLNLLAKVRVGEGTVHNRIFQYAMRGQKIDDDESIFRQITKYNLKDKQISGYFRNNSNNTSNHNIYYKIVGTKLCKYPFVIALKIDASIQDGQILCNYIYQRIRNSILGLSDISGFNYELLLEAIVDELRTKHLDNHILYQPIDEYKPKSKMNKKSQLTPHNLAEMSALNKHQTVPSASYNNDNQQRQSPFGYNSNVNNNNIQTSTRFQTR